MKHSHSNEAYKAGSITLGGAVAMGTGAMIGAGIFALTGQIAELAGPIFPLAFIAGAMLLMALSMVIAEASLPRPLPLIC